MALMPTTKPVGDVVPEVQCSFPKHIRIRGKHVDLHPMSPEHADGLFQTVGGNENTGLFDYMPYGPFLDIETFRKHIAVLSESKDTQFYSIEDRKTGRLVGQISHLRIDPKNRVIEIGHVLYGPDLQRTIGATEAWYLLACKAFDEGYRRLEWKCDANNSASRRAALRLGHQFEGVFRQHMIIKSRNRDSAWLSILDKEWSFKKKAVELWMDPDNFDENGQQKRDLATLRHGTNID